MKPINPGPHYKTYLKESFRSSWLFGHNKHQVPLTLPIKILLKRKFRIVRTGSRTGNAQQVYQIIVPYFSSAIFIFYNNFVTRLIKQAHGVEL